MVLERRTGGYSDMRLRSHGCPLVSVIRNAQLGRQGLACSLGIYRTVFLGDDHLSTVHKSMVCDGIHFVWTGAAEPRWIAPYDSNQKDLSSGKCLWHELSVIFALTLAFQCTNTRPRDAPTKR